MEVSLATTLAADVIQAMTAVIVELRQGNFAQAKQALTSAEQELVILSEMLDEELKP